MAYSDEIDQDVDALAEDDLSDDIVRKWDPERLLRAIARRQGRGQPLDETTRRKYERKFGIDLGHVKVYTGDFAKRVTDRHNANAVTIGNTGMILLGSSPDKAMGTRAGQALLAHELTHVKQAQSRMQFKGGPLELAHPENEDEAEEVEQEELAGEGDGESETSKAEKLKIRRQQRRAVMDRVFELFAETERMYKLRSGS